MFGEMEERLIFYITKTFFMKNFLKCFLGLFINVFILVNILFAQNKTKEEDFETLIQKTEDLAIDFPDSAMLFARKLIDLANISKSEQQYANALCVLAKVKYKSAKPDEAIEDNQKSYLINIRLNNQKEVAKNYFTFGSIYYYKANYVEATKYYLKSIDLCNTLKENRLLQKNYLGLVKVNESQKKFDEALSCAKKAVALEKIKPNQIDEAENLLAMGTCYVKLKNDSLAEKYFSDAYAIFERKNKPFPKAFIFVKFSDLYYETDPLKSIEYQLKAQKIFDTIAPNCLTSAYNIVYLGESLFELGKNDSLINEIKYTEIPNTKEKLMLAAENYYKRGLLLTKLNKNTDGQLTTLGLISDLQAYKGDYKNAYNNLQYKFKFNDSLFSQKNKNAIAKLESEREILQLQAINQQKSTLNKFLIGSAIGLVLFSLLGYRNFKNKQKVSSQQQELQQQKITELEKDKQLSAIDAMLQGQEEERSRIAKDLHDGLGGMLSGTKLSFINMKENLVLTPENAVQFDKSISMLDNTIADLRKVAHNLMPEALVKFGLQEAVRDFCNSIQSSTNLKVVYQPLGENRKLSNTAEVFTYRIIQELVNNAVKHANASQIIVQLTTNNNKVGIAVEDDGKGFDVNAIANSKGAGMDNIKYRVQYFNGTIDTVTSAGNGTSVNIELVV
jgi:two-component system, NarL family, sensor kinase